MDESTAVFQRGSAENGRLYLSRHLDACALLGLCR